VSVEPTLRDWVFYKFGPSKLTTNFFRQQKLKRSN
jgi:hypothetical protein